MKPSQFKVLAADKDITALIADRLERITVHEEPGITSDRVTLDFDNRDQKFRFPSSWPILRIWIGTEARLVYKGAYQVSEIEEPLDVDTLSVHGTALENESDIKSPRSQTYDDMSLGNLVQIIANRNGLSPVVSETLAAIKLGHIDQKKESDINLINRLGKQYGAIAKPIDGKLLVTPTATGQTASGKDMPIITIDDLKDTAGRITRTRKDNYESVSASYRTANMADAEDLKISKNGADGSGKTFEIDNEFSSKIEAKNAALAKLKALNRGTIKLNITRPLLPELSPGYRVQIVNHKAAANGIWVVSSADHELSDIFAKTSAELTVPDDE